MDHHPTVAELEGLVFGGNSDEQSRAVIAHLLRGCKVCNAALAPYLPFLCETGKSFRGDLPAPAPETYDGAVTRALAAVQRTGAAPPLTIRERKKQRVLELLAAGGLEALGKAPGSLPGLPTYEALLERSWALRHQSPEQMVQLAQAAVLVADRLTDADLSPTEILDLRCRAWTELGNAFRVNDELDRAEDALNRAAELLAVGSQDELLAARFFTVQASVFGARRLFEMALIAFDIATSTYRQHGDEHLVGRLLIMKATFIGYRGDAKGALLLLREGLTSIDNERDPGLVLTALQAQVWFLVDCGRFKDAQLMLRDLRQRGLDPGGRINELKLVWLEGHILAGLGKLEPAKWALQHVKQGLQEEDLPLKAALAGLELGTILLRQGRPREAEVVVIEGTDVFLALRIEREALASVLVARKAAEKQLLTLGVLNQVIERLRRADRE